MMNSSLPTEIVSYMCPSPWEPGGLVSPESGSNDIETEKQKDESIEVTSYMSPAGYNSEHIQVISYMNPTDKDSIDCLLCFGVNDNPFDLKTDYQINSKQLLDLHNTARSSFPLECIGGAPLELDSEISAAAQWFAQDMADKDYYSHTDSNGEMIWNRYNDRGINWTACGENIGWTQKDDTYTDTDAINHMFAGWMNSPHHRKNIMNNLFTRVGFGIAIKQWMEDGVQRKKYYFVADFADKKTAAPLLIPKPTESCTDECIKQIRWTQKHEHYVEFGVTKTRLFPALIFDVPIIESCNLLALTLWGDVTCGGNGTNRPLLPFFERTYFTGMKGKIPEDNSLQYVWGDWDTSPARFVEIEYTTNIPFPGELILLYADFQDYTGKCNPAVIGWTWFETDCFTSGIIHGVCLLSNLSDIRDVLPDEWLSKTDIRYKVWYKGAEHLLQSSDYATYAVGDRCIIFKGGFSQIEKDGVITLEPACRGPVPTGGVIFEDGDPLSDATVSYNLSIATDIVVPITFWSEGA